MMTPGEGVPSAVEEAPSLYPPPEYRGGKTREVVARFSSPLSVAQRYENLNGVVANARIGVNGSSMKVIDAHQVQRTVAALCAGCELSRC